VKEHNKKKQKKKEKSDDGWILFMSVFFAGLIAMVVAK